MTQAEKIVASDFCKMKPIDFFICSFCGRSQKYAPDGFPGGITRDEALEIGWKVDRERWRCPFCADRIELLKDAIRKRAGVVPPDNILKSYGRFRR